MGMWSIVLVVQAFQPALLVRCRLSSLHRFLFSLCRLESLHYKTSAAFVSPNSVSCATYWQPLLAFIRFSRSTSALAYCSLRTTFLTVTTREKGVFFAWVVSTRRMA